MPLDRAGARATHLDPESVLRYAARDLLMAGTQIMRVSCPCGEWSRVFPAPRSILEQRAVTMEIAAHQREHEPPKVPTVQFEAAVI